mgnify:CR=1 FL=1
MENSCAIVKIATTANGCAIVSDVLAATIALVRMIYAIKNLLLVTDSITIYGSFYKLHGTPKK